MIVCPTGWSKTAVLRREKLARHAARPNFGVRCHYKAPLRSWYEGQVHSLRLRRRHRRRLCEGQKARMSETGQQRPTSRPRAGGPDARRPGPPSPQGSPQGEPRQSATRFAMLLALARGAVAWANIWPAVWPLLGALGAFLAVALSALLPAPNAWLHTDIGRAPGRD